MSSPFYFVFVAILAIPSVLHSQWICTNKNGSPCSDADVDAMFCKPEKAPSNLIVPRRLVVEGTLIDNASAIFASTENKKIAIQLLDGKTGKVLTSGEVSQEARFSLGTVEQGTYRLIAVVLRSGHAERLRGWQQPENLICGNGPACELQAMVKADPTDSPLDFCPPK